MRSQYVFIDEAPSIDEVDQIAGGAVRHVGGGVRHSDARDAERTHLAWEFDELPEAYAAARRLQDVRGVDRIDVAPTADWRAAHGDDLRLRYTDASAGRVKCPNCQARLPPGEALTYALQGRRPGDEAMLPCVNCGLTLAWMVAPGR